MTFNIIYEPDFERLIMAVNNDSTATIPAIRNASGNAILAYNQAQIGLIVPGVNIYKVESETGNLCGFFALQVGPPAKVLFQQVRPNFQSLLDEINQNIVTFINEGGFSYDVIN